MIVHGVTKRLDAAVEEEPMNVGDNNTNVVAVDDMRRDVADGDAHHEEGEVGQGIDDFHNDAADNDDPQEENSRHHFYNAFGRIEVLVVVDPKASMTRMVKKNHVP